MVDQTYLVAECNLLGHWVFLVLWLCGLADHDVVSVAVHSYALALASYAADKAALGLRARGASVSSAELGGA